MNRKRQIEKAAHEYINSDVVPAWNETLAFGDFINGAEWADEHPKQIILSAADRGIIDEIIFALNSLGEYCLICNLECG